MTESGGMPQDLPGFETSNIDGEINRLENSIRDGIGPRISGVSFQPLELRNGRHALVLRVPRSFSRPHVVTFNRHWRFYARSSAGKYPMDVGEVRQAFVLSESVADRIRAFRADRLGRVVSGETPVAIKGTARVVFHVAPLSAFDSPASFVDLDMGRPPLSEGGLLPISTGGSPRYNFDGVLCDARLGAEVVGYVQLFRTGVVEAADNYAFLEEEGRADIAGYKLEEDLIEAAHRYFRLLRELGVEPPIFLMLSLIGVRGYQMMTGGPTLYAVRRPVDRDELVVPEVIVESLEQNRFLPSSVS
jgi:hypothetical protein